MSSETLVELFIRSEIWGLTYRKFIRVQNSGYQDYRSI
jgi:hypothetical protein